MNVHATPSRFTSVEMSTDGELMIPEHLRRAAGLLPGMPVVLGLNQDGEVTLMTRTQAKRRGESTDQRRERLRAALDDITGRYATGRSTDEIMSDLRGDAA